MKIRREIESPAHVSRMIFLLEHKDITLLPFARVGRKRVYSNCWGTLVFVLGAENLFMKKFRHEISKGTIDIQDARISGRCIFPIDRNRPGYADREYMLWFLDAFCREENELQRDVIVCTHSQKSFSSNILHSGICVGELDAKARIFEQNGYGKHVQIKTYDEVVSRTNVQRTSFYRCDLFPDYPPEENHTFKNPYLL